MTWRRLLSELMATRAGAFGLIAVALLLIVAIFAPLVASHDPNAIAPVNRLQGPSVAHFFGTDQLGRDLYSRIVYGTRIAISVAVVVLSISLTIGILLGVSAAYAPRVIDQLILSIFDIINSFPRLILALALVAVLGAGLTNLILLVSIAFIPQFGRIARAQTLAIRNSLYFEAEQVLGAEPWRILLQHVLPNIIGPIFVLASMNIPVVITIEAGLSFLGVGVRPPLASWGGLLHDGYTYLDQSPWLAITAGLSLMFATLGFTLLGEALRDAIDPKLRQPRVTEAALLSVRGLEVRYATDRGPAQVLGAISLDIPQGTVVGIVGESGSGKSTLALALMGLLPANASQPAGSLIFDGDELATLSLSRRRRLRGTKMAMVFQDPMSALHPLFAIGTQMVDVQRAKNPGVARGELWRRAAAMLTRVGVPDAAERMGRYPHEFSGGMRQRVMIAMALLVEPKLLIADEPTTALDATIEAQIVELLRDIRREIRGSVILISHSLGLVAELCDQIVVMYAGKVVETGPVAEVFAQPRHPYTRALLGCEIDPWQVVDASIPLPRIPGSPPDLVDPPRGCVFAARCPQRFERCSEPPPLTPSAGGRAAACWLA